MRKDRIVSNPMDYFEEVQEGRWKPQNGDEYYYIDDMGDIVDVVRHNNDVDVFGYRCGNCFQTEKQAKAYKYLVEHKQWMRDNIVEYRCVYCVNGGWRCNRFINIPSEFDVPSDRTEKQREEHEKKLRLVYYYLFK